MTNLATNENQNSRTVSISDRFWKFVEKRKSGCWTWKGCTDKKGYGRISSRRGLPPKKAYRLSWEIHFGEIPKGLEVCHACDNPSCVNPNHLMIGTHQANMMDAHRKNRINNYKHGKGEDNNSALLTNEQVKQIRDEFSNGSTVKQLSKKYKNTNITRILRNKAYEDNNFNPINGNKKPRPHRRVLNSTDIDFILASNEPSRRLGALFGISKTTILNIKKNRGYK